MRRMIYDGDSFYELDEDCLKKKEEEERRKEAAWQKERTIRADKTVRRREPAASNHLSHRRSEAEPYHRTSL